MLLDFTRSTLAPQSCKFALVKQPDDDVFARSKFRANNHQIVVRPAEASSTANRHGTIALGHHTSRTEEKHGSLVKVADAEANDRAEPGNEE